MLTNLYKRRMAAIAWANARLCFSMQCNVTCLGFLGLELMFAFVMLLISCALLFLYDDFPLLVADV